MLLILGGKAVLRDWRLLAGCFFALLLILHSVLAMKLHNVRISPEPHRKAELCTRGVYHWIRHPMYTGTLGGFVFVAVGAGSLAAWLLWLALAIVLWAKLRREEQLWLAQTPAYADYMKATKRLIPFVL